MATLLDGTTFDNVRVTSTAMGANIFIGMQAGDQLLSNIYARNNTFVGDKAGGGIQSGNNNTLFGVDALYGGGGVTGIYDNVAVGNKAMFQSQMATSRNVAIGDSVMINNGSSCNNVAIGYRAMSAVQLGRYNVFVGYIAGACVNMGTANIGIGYKAARNIGNGSYNIGLGDTALPGLTVGNNNIAIGVSAGFNVVNANYTISVGTNATTSDNNGHTIVGNCFVTQHRTQGVAWAIASDSRDKTDINQLDNNLGLNFIRNLRPVKFNFDIREAYVDKCGFEFGIKDGTLKREDESYGFIAQEMEETLNELNVEFDGLKVNQDKSKYKLTYDNLIAPIVKSLQETIERLEYLESKV